MVTNRRRHALAGVGGLQGRIENAMRAGASLDQVDAQIIGSSAVGHEHRAAMWMYARSLERGRQRYASRQALVARRAREGRAAVGTD